MSICLSPFHDQIAVPMVTMFFEIMKVVIRKIFSENNVKKYNYLVGIEGICSVNGHKK